MSHTQASHVLTGEPEPHDPESFAIAITVIVALHVVVWILNGAGVLS
jgi:hypothetical protein